MLITKSIIQGGNGFPVLLPVAYQYIVTGEYLRLDIPDDDIPDPFVKEILKQVHLYTVLIISFELTHIYTYFFRFRELKQILHWSYFLKMKEI